MTTHKQIFVNLPCKDLPASKAFFEAMGYGFNPQFTNDKGASLILGDNLFVMLLTRDFAQTFTSKTLPDPKGATTGWVCLSCDSRGEVDELVAKAKAAGATIPSEPQDYGFMYGHGFEDLDGHHWELVYMSGTPPQA
ncbi:MULTISPECIES: VOC family protein [Roseateles]|uniref:Lactoylglutathione lyase n=1 Tax=Pelomonas aquatica TaxID=431058 RepID=A0ABU1ZE04_9BURK|nr:MULTISPECIES: VOC family protein [Roseateles]KQY85557.1 extradiol dioxygenase [Pelomonas sp. Root1444]MDR7298859.1 putative lactoylglutathione lyase [Pelomonas aquatica]